MEQSERVRLELPLILPEVDDANDPCAGRLVSLLTGRPGVERVHIKTQEGSTPLLCLHYDPSLITVSRLRELVSAVGAQLSEQFAHYIGCAPAPLHSRSARLFSERLREIPGVLEAEVSVSGRIRVEYERAAVARTRLEGLVKSLGTELTDASPASENDHDHDRAGHARHAGHKHAHEQKGTHSGHKHAPDDKGGHAGHTHAHGGVFGEHTELIFAVIAGVCVLAGWLLDRADAGPGWLPQALYVGAYFFGGYFTVKEAVENLRARRFEIDTLMLVAAAGAAALGNWAEGALLLFLFSLGHSLEHFAMGRARQAIEALAKLAPETAVRKRGEELEEVPVASLAPGDIVLVKPNERLPADGVVVNGTSSVNQAPVTGESIPVDKQPVTDAEEARARPASVVASSVVFAGTINGGGAIEIETTRRSNDTTLAKVVRMVSEAETQKSPTQRFTDRFERVFVPLVLGLAFVLLFAWVVVDEPFRDSFYRAMAVLVAASPCALAIATPSAVLSGVARAARAGVLVKGGAPLENLGALDAIAFDKTGTLTEGKPRITDVVPFGQTTEDELLKIAVAVERLSDHPLAEAIVRDGSQRLATAPARTATDLRSLTGKGVTARLEGEEIWIGKPEMFGADGIAPLGPDTEIAVAALRNEGRTLMVVRQGNKDLGIIGLLDTPRSKARETLTALRALGIRRMIMISGDHQKAAQAVAGQVGLTEAWGDLMPEDKVEAIKKLRAEAKVAMVGDGVNDAPAMATATVGVAMGAAGSDVALETADVALMADDLSKLPFTVGLSRQTRRIIRQNLFVSLGVVAFLVPATIFGLGIGPAVALHEGSTLLVVFNALRLLAWRGPREAA